MAERVKIQGVVRRITKGEVREEGEVPPSFVQIGGVSVLAGREIAELPGLNDEVMAQVSTIVKERDGTGGKKSYYPVHIMEKWRPVEL